MKTLGMILGIILIIVGIILFGVIGWYFIEILSAVVEGARELEPTVYVPLFVTVLTAALGLSGTLYIQWGIRNREIEAAHRERKLEIYLEFMVFLEKLILSQKKNLKPMSEVDIGRELISIRTRAVLWGSPRVLRAFTELARPDKSQKEILQNMDEIQRAMRADLGLSNSGLGDKFFVRIALKDPSELDNLK